MKDEILIVTSDSQRFTIIFKKADVAFTLDRAQFMELFVTLISVLNSDSHAFKLDDETCETLQELIEK